MKKSILIYAVTGTGLLGLLIWALIPRALSVDVSHVQLGHFEQTIDEDGQLRVRERYQISAPLAGKLRRISFKVGDKVTTDTVLVVIEPAAPALLDARTKQELTERLGAADANKLRTAADIERVQAALAKAQADHDRAKTLAEKGVVSTSQLEQVELALEIAAHELEAARYADHAAAHDVELARAALTHIKAENKLTKTSSVDAWKLRSPIAGQVLRVIQESETMVALGTPLLEVGNVSDLEVVVDVLSNDAVQIVPGAMVHLMLLGKPEPLEARVRHIEPSAFTKVSALGVEEQRVNVIMDITSAFEQWNNLGDGYRVDARIVVASLDNVVVAPTSALFREGDQWAVFMLTKNNRASKRVVHIAMRSGLQAVVEKGLAPGDTVIVHPGDMIEDNVRVKPNHI